MENMGIELFKDLQGIFNCPNCGMIGHLKDHFEIVNERHIVSRRG